MQPQAIVGYYIIIKLPPQHYLLQIPTTTGHLLKIPHMHVFAFLVM